MQGPRTAVLADGRVAVVGGEYTAANQSWNFTLTNMGMVFDPVTLSWQPLPPPPSTGSPNNSRQNASGRPLGFSRY